MLNIEKKQDGKNEQSEEVILSDRQNRTILKSIQELANEFVEQFAKLEQNGKGRTIWEEITECAEELYPELSKAMSLISFGPDNDSRIELFKNLCRFCYQQ